MGFEARVVFWYCLPPNQPCIFLFRKFLSGTPTSNRRELRLHLNVVPIGAGVLKSRHILLHEYVNRIMITYLWRQIQLIIPSRRFRFIECHHFDLFWKCVTWSLFPRITWYSLFHTSYHIKYKTFSNITKILIISTLGGKFSLPMQRYWN